MEQNLAPRLSGLVIEAFDGWDLDLSDVPLQTVTWRAAETTDNP